MKMIRLRNRIRAALCATILALCCLMPSFPALSDTGGALTVGVPEDRHPVFYPDPKTGEIVGIGVDLMRIATEKAGYTLTFVPIREESLIQALDNREYDLLMPFGNAITSASGQQCIVSDSLNQTPFTLLTRNNTTTLPTLNRLRIGMLTSQAGIAETVRGQFPGVTIALFRDMHDSVMALRGGQVDALLNNSYVWSYVLQKPSYLDLSTQPSAMISMDFRAGAADTPAGQEIIRRLNGGIAAITDAQRQAIVLDYTTRRLYKYDLTDYLQQYGEVVLLALLLIIAIVVIVLQYQYSIRLKQEEKLRKLTDYDPLTGALNLNGFRKRVEELLREHPDIPYVLGYVNIRNFKYVNDSLGMDAGDELLSFWLSKSMEFLEEDEAVCRINGDHVAVLARAGGEERIIQHEKAVIDHVRNYFLSRGRETRLQICCGIYVLTPADYRQVDVDHMLDYARVAEKKVRETRRDGYAFYNQEQWEKGRRVTEVINHLPEALRYGDIHVWYQPQVNSETGEIIGAEALSRWEHKTLGQLGPSSFIEALEDSGMIYDLDRYVWNRVCQDLHRWNEQGFHRSVSVNVSRRDFREGRDIPRCFRDLIQTWHLTADQLRIEITESAFAENAAQLIRNVIRLQEYGFEVEMDDFGSGYSSLHMLKEVPVDRIKLDLNFLTESGDQAKGRVIISHMIQMVRSLGMRMIVEGVEAEEQARFLMTRGCTEMQGFWFHRPMPVKEFEKVCGNQ